MTHRLSTCWKGYAPAELWRESPHRDYWPCVLEITERLWELLHDQTLRGQVWELFRTVGDHKRVEVSGRLVDLVDPRALRSDVQIEPVVCRVYRTVDIAWDVRPVLPARQVLGPVVDAPPPTAAPGIDPRTVVGSPAWEADQTIARAALKEALKSLGKSSGNGKAGHS